MMDREASYVKYDPDWGIRPIEPLPEVPAYSILTESAKRWPDKVALICCGYQVTYEELNKLSDQLAQVLVEQFAVKQGDRVGTMMPNCIQHSIAFFAILKTGAVAVPCNVMYKPRELAYQLKDAEIETLLALDVFYPVIAQAQPGSCLKNVLLTHFSDFAADKGRVPPPFQGERREPVGTHDMLKLMAQSTLLNEYAPVDVENDLGLILYTAGTTGVSKGVMESHRNILACTFPTIPVYDLTEKDTSLQIMPMFHCSGYCLVQLPILAAGGTVVHVPLFNPEHCAHWVREHEVSIIFAPPTFYVGLLNNAEFNKHGYPSLRITLSCGGPQPEPVRTKWEKTTGRQLWDGYGMTETMCQGASVLSMPNKYRPGAIGSAFNCEVKVVDDQGEMVPRRKAGELMMRGVGIAEGYWRKPEETEKAFVADGWLHSGDAGYMDEDGFVYFVDRYKDIIVASGYNVAPAEVEAALMSHPAVREAAVIGVPDEYRGETIKAFISLTDNAKTVGEGEQQLIEDILSYCKEHLATFKLPRAIEVLEEIPKSAVGKVLRRQLRERQ